MCKIRDKQNLYLALFLTAGCLETKAMNLSYLYMNRLYSSLGKLS